MKLPMLFIVSVLALSGCEVNKVKNFKDWEAANKLTDIEKADIKSACDGSGKGSEECTQLAEIQGRACFNLVKQDTAAKAACPAFTPTTQSRLQCTVNDFELALAGKQYIHDQVEEVTEMHARALYCHANTLTKQAGLPEAQQAGRELATLPANPERDQLAASAALYEANNNQAPVADRCSAARSAVSFANRGLQNNPPGDLQQGLGATREHAITVAGTLPNCSVQ